MRKGTKAPVFFFVIIMLFTVSCAAGTQDTAKRMQSGKISDELTYERSMELDYAKGFSVDYYNGGYALICVSGDGRFLVVPEGKEAPGDLAGDITVLRRPVKNIYLAASAVMDMFRSLDALELIRLSGTREDSWYIREAKEAMADGGILYAGKYNAPDYELILSQNCDLSIQSTMITHSPEIKERLEEFGIPVLVDRSSYEAHPLGRTEWVKLYGALTGKEEAAEQAFREQEEAMEEAVSGEPLGKTVAFFYITANGTASVRKSGDYVPKMIGLAGGDYIFEELGDPENASSSVNMQMEEFYAGAKDADYLIYNSTVDGGVGSLEELLLKSPVLKDFKAVKEGRVWCSERNLYQDSMSCGTMTAELHKMLTMEEGADEKLTYLYRLK